MKLGIPPPPPTPTAPSYSTYVSNVVLHQNVSSMPTVRKIAKISKLDIEPEIKY